MITKDGAPRRRVTIGCLLTSYGGIGPGFDFARLFLSLSVVAWHSFLVSYGGIWYETSFLPSPARLLIVWIVPAFFGLSGFLVAGSMLRVNKITVFTTFRALRILPALTLEVVLSAFLLGPLVTSYTPIAYFSDSGFWRYLLNIAGIIHFELPGVFLENPLRETVNDSLWTVPAELYCYLILIVLMGLRVSRNAAFMLAILTLIGGVVGLQGLADPSTVAGLKPLAAATLVQCFLSGVVIFLWRDRVPASPMLCAGCFVTYLTVFYLVPFLVPSIGALCITYCVIYAGMIRFPRIPLLMSGDYSYGIYLYAFPIQQTLVWLAPTPVNPFVLFALAATLAASFAALSWHLVEKPALGLRRRFAPRTTINGAGSPIAPV
ncbi:MAG: acyltransferase [Acetobacteraceae bacterium]